MHGQSSEANCAESIIGQNKKRHSSHRAESNVVNFDGNPALSPYGPPQTPLDTPDDISRLVSFHWQLSSRLVLAYSDRSEVVYAQRNDQPTPRVQVVCTWFAPDPWSRGNFPTPPSPVLIQFLAVCMSNDSEQNMSRPWFDHPEPRLLILEGKVLCKELLGTHTLSYECCTLLVRRIAQIERSMSVLEDGGVWRKFMEPDFTTLIIRGVDPRFAMSVQREFHRERHIEQCRLFVFPTILHDGWCCYILDMMRKRITVLDPQAGPFGFSTERVKFHAHISGEILGAFFRCVQAFYSDWPCSSNGWTRTFPTIMAENFPSEDSGICALFMARNYDGGKLVLPTTKENIRLYRLSSLHEAMKLEDNRSSVPAMALQSIRASVNQL